MSLPLIFEFQVPIFCQLVSVFKCPIVLYIITCVYFSFIIVKGAFIPPFLGDRNRLFIPVRLKVLKVKDMDGKYKDS